MFVYAGLSLYVPLSPLASHCLFELKLTLRNSSHFSASHVVLKTWKCWEWRCLQNENGIETTLGTANYSFSLFCINNYFVLKAVLSCLQRINTGRQLFWNNFPNVSIIIYFIVHDCLWKMEMCGFVDSSLRKKVNVLQISSEIKFGHIQISSDLNIYITVKSPVVYTIKQYHIAAVKSPVVKTSEILSQSRQQTKMSVQIAANESLM